MITLPHNWPGSIYPFPFLTQSASQSGRLYSCHPSNQILATPLGMEQHRRTLLVSFASWQSKVHQQGTTVLLHAQWRRQDLV